MLDTQINCYHYLDYLCSPHIQLLHENFNLWGVLGGFIFVNESLTRLQRTKDMQISFILTYLRECKYSFPRGIKELHHEDCCSPSKRELIKSWLRDQIIGECKWVNFTDLVCPVWKFNFCTSCSFSSQKKVDSLLIWRSSWGNFFTSFGILIKNLDKVHQGPYDQNSILRAICIISENCSLQMYFNKESCSFFKEALKLLVPLRSNWTFPLINAVLYQAYK